MGPKARSNNWWLHEQPNGAQVVSILLNVEKSSALKRIVNRFANGLDVQSTNYVTKIGIRVEMSPTSKCMIVWCQHEYYMIAATSKPLVDLIMTAAEGESSRCMMSESTVNMKSKSDYSDFRSPDGCESRQVNGCDDCHRAAALWLLLLSHFLQSKLSM